MHEYSTRASQNRRQASAINRGLLAAALFWGMAGPALPAAQQPKNDASITATSSLTPLKPAHDIAISLVSPGDEGLQLAARLEQNGSPIGRDIAWRVTDQSGATVLDTVAPATSQTLPPGTYKVTALYGSARFEQMVDLAAGQRLDVNFLLNMGAIRVMARLEGLQLGTPARNFLYATSGPDRGKLITISSVPGEILRLAAGTYRLESRIEPGNAVVVTDVTITPGIMASVEVAHSAGVAQLTYPGANMGEVHWQIVGTQGEILASLAGSVVTAVLKPGNYRAEAQVAGRMSSASFNVSAGQQNNIILGQ